MANEKSEEKLSLVPLTEKPKLEGHLAEIVMAVFPKSPEAISLLEMYRMMREMYITTRESLKEQLKIRYCLYSILSIAVALSVILMIVFYFVLNMTDIGLSFIGPLATGILGLIVVLVSGRRK